MKRKSFLIALLMGFAVGVLGFSKVNAESNFVYYEEVDGIGTITVCDPGRFKTCVTMMDKNLGASVAGTGEDSYGYHFQWGNGHGFMPCTDAYGCTAFPGGENADNTQVDTSGYGPGNWYMSGTFIYGHDNWDAVINDNLRGGSGDDNSNDYGLQSDVPVTDRQGPCPNGYHIPSYGEFWLFMNAWGNNNTGNFQEVFNIPFNVPLAGFRLKNNAVYHIGGTARFWTSTPSKNSIVHAFFIDIDANGYRFMLDYRSSAFSLRCFKNSPLNFLPTMFQISFYDEDQTTQIWSGEVESGTILSNSGTVMDILADYTAIIKTGHTFSGWFISGTDTQYDLTTAITGNLDLVARWDVNEYTIIFDTDGGSAISPITAPYNAPVSAPANPTKAGAVFDSWSPAFPDTMPLGGATLKAIWRNALNNGGTAGGGGVKKEKDDCPNGDYSDSYYDGTCGSKDSSQAQNDGEGEFQIAYERAYENGITTMDTVEKADLNGNLTRIAMAKMLSKYAINVLGKTPDETRTNKFNDVDEKLDAEYDDGVSLAYQLGIMGINMPNNNFRPFDLVSRAEFVTALSRMRYGTPDGEYAGTAEYYKNHMEILSNEGIVSLLDPEMLELRGYVMVMLMRSSR